MNGKGSEAQSVDSPHAVIELGETSSSLGAQASGLLPGPWYYTAQWLHRRPTPLHPIRPEYPPAAAQIVGRVLLLLLIDETGGLDSYRILEASPEGIFEDATISAFTKARYAPGLISDHPVRSQLLVEVTFEPGEAPRVGAASVPQ